jgi:amino acid adenylation domain-containing protein
LTNSTDTSASPSGAPDDFDPFAGGEIARVVPTTEPQMEIWLAAKMQPEASLSYNESVVLRLRGLLDVAALQAALDDLVGLHEALRATVSPDGLQLLISARGSLPLSRHDLASLPASAREERLADVRRSQVLEPFDLENGPLIRAELLRLGEREHALLLTAHHIVCDGWSFGVLVQDLAALYGARVAGQPAGARPPGRIDFGDYALERAAFKETDEYRALERYWVAKVGGDAPVLELPTDHERVAPRSYRSEREDGLVPPALLEAVRKACAPHGASLFVTLLAAFSVLVHRLSGQREFIVGVPAAGQNTEGRERLVGHAVHLLPIRVQVDPAEPFAVLLLRLRREMLDAFDHQGYTFGSLLRKLMVERDASRPTLVSVMFNVDQLLQVEGAFSGLEAEFQSNPRAFENFDISVNVVQEGGGLRAECQYGCELFEPPTIRGWLESYRSILAGVAADTGIVVGDVDMLTPADRAAWERLNATPMALPAGATDVWTMFEQQVAATPDRIAASDARGSLTYRQLREAAGRLSTRLVAAGAAPGERIGISLERSCDMLAAVLGTLRTGAAYVPLDPAFPRDRLAFMVDDARMKCVLTQSSLAGQWQGAPVRTLLLEEASEATGQQVDTIAGGPARDSVAYVIYTSGSTGKPKGVCVPHSAVVNFLASMQREPGMSPDDRLLAVTTLSFDIAVLELLLPLTVGAQVVIATRDEAMDGQSLRELIERHRITMLQATPSTWRLLLESGWAGTQQLRALCGGEPLPADLARDLVVRVREVWNMYGPTETTVWSTVHRVGGEESSIPIGHPIGNTQVYVLDERGHLCPVGVRGELWIAGDGVTLGYWDRPELSAERFLPDAFSASTGARMYRTGDLGRLCSDGTLECAGRTDFQVKVRGHRIELGEIEAVLATHAGVARCVVDARPLPSGERALCAYVVWRDGKAGDGQELREHLRQHLPEYMVPSAYVALESVPLTPNGKVDRRALPAPDGAALRAASAAFQAPQTPTEIRLAAIWSELLCTPQVSRHDNFFDLGGHSLLAMRAIALMQRDSGRRVRPASYVLETLSQIASHYDSQDAASDPVPETPAGLFGRLMATIRRRP